MTDTVTDEEKQKLETAAALLKSSHAVMMEDRASMESLIANPDDFTGDLHARIFDHYDKAIAYLDAKASFALQSIALGFPDITRLRERVDKLAALVDRLHGRIQDLELEKFGTSLDEGTEP